MNPYDFVRLDWASPPERLPYTPHDRFTGWTGRIDCTLAVETPLFMPKTGTSNPAQFITNGMGVPIVPGSSLKGLLRSLVETLAPGCWWLFDGTYERGDIDYRADLPVAFQRCTANAALCPACRMFGLIERGGDGAVLLGKVGVDDAVSTTKVDHPAVFTPILDNPKPHHEAWYLDAETQHVAGRKFYFHQPGIQTVTTPQMTKSGIQLNAHIRPLGVGSVFVFSVPFTNVSDSELALLVFVLALEPSMRHKLGYAKPAGFGSVRIEIKALQRQDMARRYAGDPPEQLTGDTLLAFIDAQAARARARIPGTTLADLRRIWHWPSLGEYSYPGRPWFNEHGDAPISATNR